MLTERPLGVYLAPPVPWDDGNQAFRVRGQGSLYVADASRVTLGLDVGSTTNYIVRSVWEVLRRKDLPSR